MIEPHFGQGFSVQGMPLWCGTVCPQEEHLHIPLGPAPGLFVCFPLPLTDLPLLYSEFRLTPL